MQMIELLPDELVAILASMDTVMEKVGPALLEDDPYKHGVMVATRAKVFRYYVARATAVRPS